MLSTIKHSKYKNTGILFELLVRQITADTLSGSKSKAVDILKQHFVKSELGKEYRLYETLLKSSNLQESKATLVVDTLIEASKRLNKKALKREKYNLIKEIKANYNLEEFFKTKLPNYKVQAAFSILLQVYGTAEMVDPNQIVQNKVTVLEHLTTKQVDNSKVQAALLEEFQGYDKDLRILTYKILLEKFNGKYANLNDKQKQILQQYVASVDSAPKLRDYYNDTIDEVKKDVVGQKVFASMDPSEQFVKVVYDRILSFLGGEYLQESFGFQIPSTILVMGLQGSGKTTTLGKLAYFIQKQAEKRGKSRKKIGRAHV